MEDSRKTVPINYLFLAKHTRKILKHDNYKDTFNFHNK